MNRLIKKSVLSSNALEAETFIQNWVGYVKMIHLDSVIQHNQDCMFSGTCYRALSMDLHDAAWNLAFSLDNKDYITNTEVEKALSEFIHVNNNYCSWSKNISDAEKFGLEKISNGSSRGYTIISANITGLDLNKLVDKYIDNDGFRLSGYTIKCLQEENEILAPMTSNYKIELIYDLQDRKKYVGNYQIEVSKIKNLLE